MPKSARTKKPGRRPGSGRRPIPADLYLLQWSSVVEMLKDGHSGRAIKAKHGTCAETVRHVRRFMIQGGWTPPVRVPKKTVRPPREPRPPRVGMTAEERLHKHSGVAFWFASWEDQGRGGGAGAREREHGPGCEACACGTGGDDWQMNLEFRGSSGVQFRAQR
jgi:hypothetical protein